VGHLEGQGFLVGFLTPVVKKKGKKRSHMKPSEVVGIQRYPLFQDGQPPFPLPIQGQEPAQKAPMRAGALGLRPRAISASDRNSSRSLRKKCTWARAARPSWFPGSRTAPLCAETGPFPGVIPRALSAERSFGYRERPTGSRPDRTPDPASRLAPARSGSRQRSQDSRRRHGGRTAGRPHRSRELRGACGGIPGTGFGG